jgi:oligo-alginate lyase
VDDGDGYVEGEQRWRFIGAYLIYGQWKQAIVTGIRNLAAAYLVTGDPIYAHKAGVMLDRVADLYPTFDFGKEGVMYEGPPSAGYVSTWHDACVEVYDLTLAYDMVFEAIAQDATLVSFLAEKAQRYRLPNSKSSFREIQQNIEDGILRDTLANRPKIESNYPSTDITIAAIQTVLGWPDNRAEVTAILDRVMERSTAVDGLSGEKGIAGYSTIAPRTIADLLGRYERMEPGFIEAALQRQPRLRELYRFHLDTWCFGEYYPCIGDSGAFAQKVPYYPAVAFSRAPDVGPSGFTFLDRLAAATGDNDFIRLLYTANDHQVDGLPYDLFAEDPGAFQQRVSRGHCGRRGRDPAGKRQQDSVVSGNPAIRTGGGRSSRVARLRFGRRARARRCDELGPVRQGTRLDARLRLSTGPIRRLGRSARRVVHPDGCPQHRGSGRPEHTLPAAAPPPPGSMATRCAPCAPPRRMRLAANSMNELS